jgi:hypothetical protein
MLALPSAAGQILKYGMCAGICIIPDPCASVENPRTALPASFGGVGGYNEFESEMNSRGKRTHQRCG